MLTVRLSLVLSVCRLEVMLDEATSLSDLNECLHYNGLQFLCPSVCLLSVCLLPEVMFDEATFTLCESPLSLSVSRLVCLPSRGDA